ncbi:hypothetical protein BD626DRAFT_490551 [Schizophyllum amplum]|uniref:Lanthionine synthetase C-like protein n=1 Tax=Schizophyllum amplum TaxID=97359 RepID=A0A550CJM6_9AGAR|nr:hypothetical protein BD626DRAFT_490551 [Auriculariopsis ampla]
MPKRYISHNHKPPADGDLPQVEHDILRSLGSSVNDILRSTDDVEASPSVYVGLSGIVLMNMHLASLADGADLGAPDEFLALNDHYLTDALGLFPSYLRKPRTPARSAFLDTPVGLATLLLIHAETQDGSDRYPWQECLQLLERTAEDIMSETSATDDDGCEVLYGRAGFLYALLRLRGAFLDYSESQVADAVHDSHITTDATIARIAANIIAHGRHGAQTYAADIAPGPPLMWSWHGRRYLGAAHGVVGILNILLQCPPYLLTDAYDDIWAMIDWLISIQDEEGNWPSKAPALRVSKYDTNELVQWCHGAPGALILLSRALQHPSAAHHARRIPAVLRAADRAATLVYRRGLLRKGLGACHGIAGSVFALLAAARLYASRAISAGDGNGEKGGKGKGRVEGPGGLETRARQEEKAQENIMRAVHLSHLAVAPEVAGKMTTPDRPHSLYEGLAGMCCAWASVLVALRGQNGADQRWGLPGFDDL